MSSTSADFLAALRVLTEHGVDFIVVGGVCAVLHGAPISTLDLDVVHARSEENVEALLSALDELEALYRDIAGRRIKPTASHLVTPGHQLLDTRHGRVDLLGTLGDGRGFDELIGATDQVEVAGMTLRILALDELIEVKRQAGRDKDKLAVAILEHTLRERDRA